ncbi:LOW QUALITY PROTEIN: hypothetical protein HID58_056829 [Brassica napus]|uniref:Uncharacterized protein n=1 Tax=Brassica napus TaxID=3708 RepID=A0ABQ8AQW6_BRANA|nr:LOW QUALITY PROTEIN: hypothetical protein HID58_056829 [Brassica napus]
MYSNQRFRLWTTLQKLAGNLGPFVKIVSFLGRGLKGLGFVTVNAQACICNRVYGYGGSSNLVAFCSTGSVSKCGIVDSEKQPIKREISPEPDSSPPCPKISIHDYYLSSVSSTSSTHLDSAPVLGGSGLRPSLTLAPTLEAPLLFSLLVFFCSSAAFVLPIATLFLCAPSLERSSVSGVSPLVMDLRRDGFWRRCRRSRRLGFWRRSLKPLLEFGCAWRRESSLCSDLISGLLDLRGSSVCLRHWGIGALSSSVASLTEGGGVYLFLRWWLVVQRCGVGVGRLWSLRDVAATSLLFGLLSSRLVIHNRSLKLCRLVSLVFARVLFGSIARVTLFSNTAFGDDAQGSVWSAGLLGIVGGSIRCCAHPSAVASPWLLMVVSVALMLLAGLRAVQVLVQRSTCSRLLAYRSWFGSHCVSKPLASQGAFEDCIAGLGAIFNGLCFISLLHMCLCVMTVTISKSSSRASYPKDVTEIPGIRGNEVNFTFPWSTSKGITALDS